MFPYEDDMTPEQLAKDAAQFLEKHAPTAERYLFQEGNEDRMDCLRAATGLLYIIQTTPLLNVATSLMMLTSLVYAAYGAGVEYGKLVSKTDELFQEAQDGCDCGSE